MSKQFTQRDAIRNLQTYLRAQAFVDKSAPLISVDGIFDPQTRYALSEFQRKNSLQPTGIADRETWDLLYSQYLDITEGLSIPDPIIPFPSYPKDYVIKRGDKSFLIAIVQYMINEISIIYSNLSPLEINGELDDSTQNAIRDIQELSGIYPTGNVDRSTWNHIARIYNLSLHYIDNN